MGFNQLQLINDIYQISFQITMTITSPKLVVNERILISLKLTFIAIFFRLSLGPISQTEPASAIAYSYND